MASRPFDYYKMAILESARLRSVALKLQDVAVKVQRDSERARLHARKARRLHNETTKVPAA